MSQHGWTPYEDGGTIGTAGTEQGAILADEEHEFGARITLERCDDRMAVTCGIYGAMVHTVFASWEEGPAKYEAMKSELGQFLEEYDNEADEDFEVLCDFCSRFVNAW
ncbi:MAG: hypothetical protein Q4F72_10550 [Desulfovibrionaceae bacterium]|nr:hypothetical protein [Desulfovibrionaceae bacterium]